MKKQLFIFLFCFSLILGTLLRFWGLGLVPSSLNWDEVSWGYNAYSISTIGKDEYGVSYPLTFKAFGDYKQPVYVYLDSIAIRFLGLNPFSVRFPSALFGSLTIIFVFLLTKELFIKNKHSKNIALLTMLLFSISPWSVQFSRVAFEANVGLFFVIAGVWLFIKGKNEKNLIYLLSSTLPLAISCYSYHSEKVITPLLFIGLLMYSTKLLKEKILWAILIAIAFLVFNLPWIIDSRTTERGKSVTFLSNQTQVLSKSTEQLIQDNQTGDILGKVIHNRRLVFFDKYLDNYFKHFDFNYLFITGDNARHHAPGMGVLYLVSVPFIILGFYFAISNKANFPWIIFYWIIIGPAASALANEAPNASRSLIILPTWQILEAFGILYLFLIIKQKYRYLFGALVIFIFTLNIFYYVHQYFSHTNTDFGQYWQYGYKEAVDYTKSHIGSDRKVFFDNSIEQGYIFYLFYNKYDPYRYILEGGSARNESKCYSIDNAYFGECNSLVNNGDIYVTASKNPFPGSLNIYTVYNLNGKKSVDIYKIAK